MKLLLTLLFITTFCFGQADSPALRNLQKELDSIEIVKSGLVEKMEELKLSWVSTEIGRVGLPTKGVQEVIVKHKAYSLSYNEDHEQANWVMHIILPDIIKGSVTRTNDFRVDAMVKTGSAVEKDYFVKTLKSDSTYKYDGFGYDRGHLAPSADFRWSRAALSESYFYSNMSPQLPDFNRLKWAELENWMREYVTIHNTHLYIVTAPVLKDNLAKIERSIDKVSIPEYFIKVALDLKNERGIAFIFPHQKIELPLENYAVTIDSAEAVLGYDLFSQLDDNLEKQIESNSNYTFWLPEDEQGDTKAIHQKRLPKRASNTYGVHVFEGDGENHTVCGTVVSAKKHDKGHVFINLDKKFPNQIFSVSIFESNIVNFDYEPEVYLINKEVCFTGEITDYKGTPTMVIKHSKKVKLLTDY